MPFYEYECSACKFYIETLQKISDPPLKKCPSCGKDALLRLISAPVFRLKGAGWYETDFKSDKENKRNLADGAEPAAAESSSESDDKKPKVRASKTIRKVAAKTVSPSPGKRAPGKKAPGKKTTKKAAGKQAKPAQKAAKKSAKKRAVKPLSKKVPAKKKPAAKAAKRLVKQKAKKPARKK